MSKRYTITITMDVISTTRKSEVEEALNDALEPFLQDALEEVMDEPDDNMPVFNVKVKRIPRR